MYVAIDAANSQLLPMAVVSARAVRVRFRQCFKNAFYMVFINGHSLLIQVVTDMIFQHRMFSSMFGRRSWTFVYVSFGIYQPRT